MNALSTIYNLLGIKYKIPNEQMRFTYLRNVWGLEQTVIGELEGYSQSYVSRELINAAIPHETFLKETHIIWSSEELKFIQFLPREIINDIQVIAFFNNILGLDITHPFYSHYDTPVGVRCAGLNSLGVRSKHLQQIFDKSQPTVSMLIKRNKERAAKLERTSRYDNHFGFTITSGQKYRVTIAGGK